MSILCPHRIVTEGRERILKISCKDCIHGMSVEDSDICMGRIIRLLYEDSNISRIILCELLEKEYIETQTEMLKGFASLYERVRQISRRLVPEGQECSKCLEDRKARLEEILDDTLPADPLLSYKKFLKHFNSQEDRMEGTDSEVCVGCYRYYIENLKNIRRIFRSSIVESLRDNSASGRGVYRGFLSPLVRPFFSTSRVLLEPPSNASLISTYRVRNTLIRIYLPRDRPEHLYFVSPPEYHLSSEDFEIINKIRERMIRHRPEWIDFADPIKTREYFRRLAQKTTVEISLEKGRELSNEKIVELSEIITKYTTGLGILEVLLEDPNVQDVYINAPANESPLCLNHSQVEDCVTNIFLTHNDTESLISRFRARSGRAFSEANPTLDLELPEFGTRVAVIGRPLSPDGVAFALRRQKTTPWTLPQFVENRTITAQAAGLLSFLVDGQVTMLITGSRGSGKTSLLVSLFGELMQKLRILTIEDTLEIPVPKFNAIGYRIQRLKIQSAVGRSETELTPQEALATALRLGESVLVIGEVRGPETKVLYESMRVGSAGNAVLGTIHGASTESVFERVVYDIGIPASSFKSTDIVVTSAPIRRGGGLRRFRRVLQISEVTKDWYSQNPDPSEVFRDLMLYNSSKDRLEFTDEFQDSEIVGKIARRWNISREMAVENIELRAKIKQFMVDYSQKKKFSEILEIEHVVDANNRFRTLLERQVEEGMYDYDSLYEDWKSWFLEYAKEVENVV